MDRESFAIWHTGVGNCILHSSRYLGLDRGGLTRKRRAADSVHPVGSLPCAPRALQPLQHALPTRTATFSIVLRAHRSKTALPMVLVKPAPPRMISRLDLEMYCEFWHGIFADVLGRAYCDSLPLGSS